ncbi:carboxymuconolactone decarboxylase family protein [Roseovarius sp. B08]|uniref:carboxymuconolactone decarboxylase family protein n=1 Tax=Roseovarius sp. B08 TaxID=3449223 RepID=UPI003EDC6947
MSRIQLPASIDAAPAASRPFLEGGRKMLGSVPNLFRITVTSPAALEGYLGLSGALAKGVLTPQTRERVALAVTEINGCDYCLSTHAYLARTLARLDEAEIAANRAGGSSDAKADAALRFAAKLVRERGQVSDADVSAVKMAGYSDADIVAHVALNTLTNYLNDAFDTPIDFPVVSATAA